LEKIGGAQHAQEEFDKINESLQKSTSEKASISEVFTKKMAFVLLIGFGLAIFQQVSGINAVLYYAPMIFEAAGGSRDAAFLQAIVVGLVFTTVTIISMGLIDKLGRKPLLIMGSAIMATFLGLVGFAFSSATYQIKSSSIDPICQTVERNALIANARITNPKAYLCDTIIFETNKAVFFQSDQSSPLAELDLTKPEIKQIQTEKALLKTVLSGLEGQSFNSEVAMFEAVRKSLEEAASNESAEVKQYILDSFGASHKSLILKASISINSMLVLIGILGFISGFSISLGPVMWAMFSEIFPNRLRGTTISIVGAVNALTSFTVATVFPSALESLGSAITFFTFAAFMGMCLAFVIMYIPETKGKSLEELEEELIK
jgi:hypothetical protein